MITEEKIDALWDDMNICWQNGRRHVKFMRS